MKAGREVAYGVAVILAWFIYSILIKLFWADFANYNPLSEWAYTTLLPNGESIFYTFIYTHDIIVNAILILPVAYVAAKYLPKGKVLYIFYAVIISFLWDVRALIFAGEWEFYISYPWSFVYMIIIHLILFPALYLFLNGLVKTRENGFGESGV